MRFWSILIAAQVLWAQGTTPKSKPSEYPARVHMDAVTLAAGYLFHSLPTPKGTLVTNDYLVVEVAFYGPPFSRLQLSPDMFTLRLNGRGGFIPTQHPRMVAGSVKTSGGTAKGTVNEIQQSDSIY